MVTSCHITPRITGSKVELNSYHAPKFATAKRSPVHPFVRVCGRQPLLLLLSIAVLVLVLDCAVRHSIRPLDQSSRHRDNPTQAGFSWVSSSPLARSSSPLRQQCLNEFCRMGSI